MTATQIKGSEIKAGMIVKIYGGTEQVTVTRMVAKWGAVQITDGTRWYGIGENEVVELVGHFNP